jgi:hypothetical protein
MITSVNELIEEFGGVKPFAATIKRSLPPVYRAIELNRLPFSWRMTVYQEARRRKIKIAPELLGMEAHS